LFLFLFCFFAFLTFFVCLLFAINFFVVVNIWFFTCSSFAATLLLLLCCCCPAFVAAEMLLFVDLRFADVELYRKHSFFVAEIVCFCCLFVCLFV